MYRFSCLVAAFALIHVCYTCPTGCSCIGSTLNCDLALTSGMMASFVPNNTERVLLQHWGCWNLTWPDVSLLELFDTDYPCHKPILQLGNLKSLKLDIANLYRHFEIMDIQAQLGVKDLYIIGAKNLTFENIAALLNGQRFPELELLVIDRISWANNDPILSMTSNFFSVLRGKRELRRLEVINMHLNEVDILASKCPPKLEYLSFKGSNINSVKSYFSASKKLRVCESLRTLDISQTVISPLGWLIKTLRKATVYTIVTVQWLDFNQLKFFSNVTTVLMSDFNISPIELRARFTIDASATRTSCRTLDLSNNHFRFSNLSIITHRDSGIEEYNLSFNTLMYLTPAFVQPGKFVKKLHLGSNDLHFMQIHHPREFVLLLHSYMHLEYVDLSKNGLTAIPSKMFTQNERLIHLNLGNNKLTSISNLDLGVCISLKYIGLNGNKLLFQEFSDVMPIQRLITMHAQEGLLRNESQDSSAALKVNVAANTFRCTCDNLDLQRWVLEYADVFDNVFDIPLFCGYDGKDYKMITDEFEEISQNCLAKHKLRIGLIWTGSLFALICLLCGIGYFIRRKIMVRQEIRVLVKNLKNNEFPLEFLIFLSHSSADDQLVINYVLPSLSKAMKDITKSNRDFICFSDKHFRPGHTIVEEVMGCIEKSAVVVLVLSNKYIASPWCDMEAKEAATQQKPVVLVLTETIDENEMSLVLRQLFNRFARFKCFTNEEGKHEVVPTWATLSASVLDLARAQMNG